MTRYEMIDIMIQIPILIETIGLSLWYAMRSNKIKAFATISYKRIFAHSANTISSQSEEHYIVVKVTNIGAKPFIISGFSVYDKKIKQYFRLYPDYTNQYNTMKPDMLYEESTTGSYIIGEKELKMMIRSIGVYDKKKFTFYFKRLKFYAKTNIGQLINIKVDERFYNHCIQDLMKEIETEKESLE